MTSVTQDEAQVYSVRASCTRDSYLTVLVPSTGEVCTWVNLARYDSTMNLSSFLWSVADLLRGKYRPHEYGRVILPFTVLRRMDCVLEPTKQAVLDELEKHHGSGYNPEHFLRRASKASFYNTLKMDLKSIAGDPSNAVGNLLGYLHAFSADVADIFERFELPAQIDRLQKADLLYLIVEKFASVDLHPSKVSNTDMGTVFEELIRKFAELSNETAGEHFTPRDVIRLMAELLFIEDNDALSKPDVVRTVYDPDSRDGRHAFSGGRVPGKHGRSRRDGGPGAERRVLRHLQGGYAHQGAGRAEDRARRHAGE